jgi:lipopolysaccharide transport system ATP-binding protein
MISQGRRKTLMLADDIAIKVEGIGKCYHIYDKPRDRLMQMVIPRLRRVVAPFSLKGGGSTTFTAPQYYREFWAVNDVSFEVRKGETVGIIGRNGCGKSTLLQMICGTLAPTSGTVQTSGRIAALLELGSGFNPDFTGRENIYMNGVVLGLTTKEIDDRFHEITAFADIGDFIEQPVKTYSSGMLVRLAFAVSVCVEPNILVVDEALAVGDAAFQFKCIDRLKSLADQGTTILFVSHDISMVKSFCHHALYLHKGRERAKGSPEEMAELYFLDIRNEQRQTAGGSVVALKPFLGNDDGIAFGTEEGCILSACFTNSQGMFSSFLHGEEIEIRLKTKYLQSVKRPHVSLIIQDSRLMNVGGKFFPLEGASEDSGWITTAIRVRFKANLTSGRYHVTVRLEDRSSETSFLPIEKQVGLLSFEVLEKTKSFLGVVDLAMRIVPSLRVVALLTIRNEALYLARCLQHLYEQGIETCVIDNESEDDSRKIAEQFLGRGVFRIETQPFGGCFDLVAQLRLKEELSKQIAADWFMHCDADEIREAPAPFKTLYDGIVDADKKGFTAINFDEFVFLPTSDEESFEGTDYTQSMRYYYFFEPGPLRRLNAWKNLGKSVDLVSSGGHCAAFDGRKIYPIPFILRHYIVLSRSHAIAKYGRERIYSREEVEQRGWHGTRANFNPLQLRFPAGDHLKLLKDNGVWDTSSPLRQHPFLEGKNDGE